MKNNIQKKIKILIILSAFTVSCNNYSRKQGHSNSFFSYRSLISIPQVNLKGKCKALFVDPFVETKSYLCSLYKKKQNNFMKSIFSNYSSNNDDDEDFYI